MRTWTTPKVVEVCLGCEINCYMSAER
ncbi:pyrroloquinoline quinone precursor peptide PqqA [Cupriavidus taiwanensis]|uniref:Coenzyme PQQ synthesis protein A n=1 Tax=Cupriavidus taiwanensis (strain DSM 17343 / BCRC 17206 / CCUG 44338 / CIP 107171 / LMG 19424 / R1) TaxID=977880 RepID=B2AIN4_CUPTR|nr:coenzyme Pyrroloquinoline quinone (PQQ) synthesis protein A, putative precursor [Cupriavidus taiwanensis LMG 19424]